MNLRFVEAFYWVAALKGMTRAAEKLFLTQSAVSSRITALEDELGVLLVDRREKRFRLTPAGARFLAYAERLLSLQRDLRAEMRSAVPASVTLRVGAIESVMHSWLIPLLEALRAEQPGFELELTVETTPVLLEQIRRGRLDLVFAAAPAGGDGVRSVALPPMEMVFVGRKGPRARLALREIGEQDVLTFQRGSQPYVALMDLFRAGRVTARRIHPVSSIAAMVKLVESGFGLATLPKAVAESACQMNPRLRIVRSPARLAALPLHASYRLDPGSTALEPAVHGALRFIRGHRKNR